MRVGNARAVLVAIGICLLGIGVPVWADAEPTPAAPGRVQKLGRGLANIASCPLELIRTPVMVSRREGYVSGMSVGLVDGIRRTVLRAVVGTFEILTFYAEIPKGFKPIVEPEFVWAHGNWAD